VIAYGQACQITDEVLGGMMLQVQSFGMQSRQSDSFKAGTDVQQFVLYIFLTNFTTMKLYFNDFRDATLLAIYINQHKMKKFFPLKNEVLLPVSEKFYLLC
jgi:hypothetical protein